MNDNLTKLETAIGGLYISLIHAIGPKRTETALDMLVGFIADSRTGDYERKLYSDLLECIDAAANQPPGLLFEELSATVH
jgi:hypothetical protein